MIQVLGIRVTFCVPIRLEFHEQLSMTALAFASKFVSRPEFDQVWSELQSQIEKRLHTRINDLFFFLIEGMSGSGKTRIGRELVKRAIEHCKLLDIPCFSTSFKFSEIAATDETSERGFEMLTRWLCETHFAPVCGLSLVLRLLLQAFLLSLFVPA